MKKIFFVIYTITAASAAQAGIAGSSAAQSDVPAYSRAHQQARRVAALQQEEMAPARAFLLGSYVVKKSKIISETSVISSSPAKKKSPSPQN